MIFTVEPSTIKGALSSMIYQAYDTNFAQPGFYYQFKIFVWSGPISPTPTNPVATITRLPDIYAGNRAMIDASKIVQQYIADNFFTIGTALPIIGAGAVYVQVECNGIWNTGAAGTTSNKIVAVKGYEYTTEGFNSSFSNVVLTDRVKVYLTPDTAYDYLWYDATKVTSVTIGATTITPVVVNNSTKTIQGIELRQALTAASLWGTNTSIVFTHSTGTVTIPVIFNCTNKYGVVSMLFQNKYGVIEGYSFNALTQLSYEKTKETYFKPAFNSTNLNTAWSYGVPLATDYNIQAIGNQLVNSNWINDADVPVMQQIFISRRIFTVVSSILRAATISDTSFQYQTTANVKLINYTLNLKYSQPLINSIVR